MVMFNSYVTVIPRGIQKAGHQTVQTLAAEVLPGKELALRFGCDAKATLAHVDVLDFARSRLDWAPVTGRQKNLEISRQMSIGWGFDEDGHLDI